MDEEPLVSVVRGTPTDLELAALVAVLAASANAAPPPPATSAWLRSARPSIRPSSWRGSALPR
ncbi:acyl-CoA carboxylase epsilon subunit [Paractinoplanes globisporus]|uniref:Acyl-CoA carboxylase epsilon subunit n=1 Tax=Paractinoplanes globisporus TaxID=113565 RepID=A0ABW6WTD7_9ACTN|nr:acyl-CoA carboxylase epsilon subunit [Actinoplanes globisporus]